MPQFDRLVVVATTKRKVAQHLEIGEVRTITHEFDVVCAQAALQRALAAAIRLEKSIAKRLHAAADKQSRVVRGHNGTVDQEGKTELFKSTADDIQMAECRFISLSSQSKVGCKL